MVYTRERERQTLAVWVNNVRAFSRARVRNNNDRSPHKHAFRVRGAQSMSSFFGVGLSVLGVRLTHSTATQPQKCNGAGLALCVPMAAMLAKTTNAERTTHARTLLASVLLASIQTCASAGLAARVIEQSANLMFLAASVLGHCCVCVCVMSFARLSNERANTHGRISRNHYRFRTVVRRACIMHVL